MKDAADAYEENALEFLQLRDRSLVGSNVVDRWSRSLRAGAAGIELGCGGGYPLTQVLSDAGLDIRAVDSSPTLVALFRIRFPHIPVHCAKVRDCDFFRGSYEFVIAIGLLFLLPEAEQEDLIGGVSRILAPGGRCLLSAPVETSRWMDTITGTDCLSLGVARYTELFHGAGFRVVSNPVDAGGNNYYDLALEQPYALEQRKI